MAGEDLQLVVPFGITDRNSQQEPVELALRKRIRSLELERVLRGDDHERVGQPMRLAVGRNLRIAHGFEQGALGARRSTIDFVGQHDVAENRAAIVNELAALGMEDAGAGDVAGKQVGGELNAREVARHAFSKRLADERLADARNIFEQSVLAGQQGHDAQPNDLGLAQDDLRDVLLEFADQTE